MQKHVQIKEEQFEAQNEPLTPALLEGRPLRPRDEAAPNSTKHQAGFEFEDPCNNQTKVAAELRGACSESMGVRADVAAGPALAMAIEKAPDRSWPVLTKLAADESVRVREEVSGSLTNLVKKEPDKMLPLLANLTEYQTETSYPSPPAWPPSRRRGRREDRVREVAAGEPLAAGIRVMFNEALSLLKKALHDQAADVRAAAAGEPLLEAVKRLPLEDAQELVRPVFKDASDAVVKSAGRAAAHVAQLAEVRAQEAQAAAEHQTTVANKERAIAKEAQAESGKRLKIIVFLLITLPVVSIGCFRLVSPSLPYRD